MMLTGTRRALLRRAGLAFPSSIPNLVFDINPLLGMFSDAGTTPAVANDPVQQANDQSVSAANLSQATLGFRPLLIANAVNGRPILRFDGTDDLMKVASSAFLDAPTEITVLTVFKTIAANTISQHVVSKSTSVANGWNLYVNGGTANTMDWRGSFGPIEGPGGVNTNFRVITGTYISGAQLLTINGASAATGVSVTSPSTNANLLTVGSAAAGAGVFTGDLARLLVYNRALPTAERRTLEAYLGSTYTVAVV